MFHNEKTTEPAKPQTTFDAYLAAIKKDIQEAESRVKEAMDSAWAWNEELQARREIRDCFQGDTALTRRAWYLAGRKDERHHKSVRTNFPLHP